MNKLKLLCALFLVTLFSLPTRAQVPIPIYKIIDPVKKTLQNRLNRQLIMEKGLKIRQLSLIRQIATIEKEISEKKLKEFNELMIVVALYKDLMFGIENMVNDSQIKLNGWITIRPWNATKQQLENEHELQARKLERYQSDFSDLLLLAPAGGQGYSIAAVLKVMIEAKKFHSEVAKTNYEISRRTRLSQLMRGMYSIRN